MQRMGLAFSHTSRMVRSPLPASSVWAQAWNLWGASSFTHCWFPESSVSEPYKHSYCLQTV